MSDSTITVSFPSPDVALLTLDMPNKGANVLSTSVLAELNSRLDELEARRGLAGMIFISGKPGQFVAGADLREFVASLDLPKEKTVEMCRRGQILFQRLASVPFVTVAAIDGACLGGGAELAAWCDRRIMSNTPKTQFGFPEVKLGLYPGWGGNVRAPRIAGLSNAVEMITGGESITPAQAVQMGWATETVPPERLLEAALALVKEECETKSYLKDRSRLAGPISVSENELAFLGAAASGYIQERTQGNYPAPLTALETILGGATETAVEACEREALGMAQLFGSPVNAALLNVFFLTDANKKDPGIETSGQKTTDVKSVSIIGAGIMGSGIAAANLRRGLSVTIADARPEVADQAVGPILEEASYNRETKRGDLSKAVTLAGKLHVSRRTEILAQSDLVVEAVVEHLETKQRVLRELDELMPPTSILATNTSTIPITRLADGLKHPGRFCGVHFFNPVRTMQLVEVIRGPHTTDDTVAAAVKYAKQLGKFPVVLKDGPGFLINRLLMPYMNEALHLVAEGASFEQVDKAAKRFGMPMGPIELYDMVGLDTALFAGKVLCDAFPDRYHASPILLALVEVGRLGRKSGAGFFNYKNNDKKSRPAKDPQVMAILQPFIATSASAFDSRMLTSRLFLPMLNEASRALEEGLVRGPRDVDLGMIFGTGFPPFRGGLLFWADQVGIEKIFEMASTCIERGARYQPTELMTKLRRDRRRFYDLTR